MPQRGVSEMNVDAIIAVIKKRRVGFADMLNIGPGSDPELLDAARKAAEMVQEYDLLLAEVAALGSN